MIQKLIFWCARKKAIFALKRKYVLDIQVKTLLKEWVTACILERKQEGRRQELTDSIKEIQELELFYKWLKTK